MTKSITKTLIFITLDTSQLKKVMIMKVFIVQIFCICRLIMQTDILSKKWKYLIFDSTDENKEVLKRYSEVWDGIKNKIKAINDNKENDYGKDYMNIKFNSDDDLALNKPLKFHAMTIIIRSVFEEDGKLYPQFVLDDALYEV